MEWKIKTLAEKLGFETNFNFNRFMFIRNRDDIQYEIYLNGDKNIGYFSKIINRNTTHICSKNSNFEYIHNSILEEFKYELRNQKIKKLLN